MGNSQWDGFSTEKQDAESSWDPAIGATLCPSHCMLGQRPQDSEVQGKPMSSIPCQPLPTLPFHTAPGALPWGTRPCPSQGGFPEVGDQNSSWKPARTELSTRGQETPGYSPGRQRWGEG